MESFAEPVAERYAERERSPRIDQPRDGKGLRSVRERRIPTGFADGGRRFKERAAARCGSPASIKNPERDKGRRASRPGISSTL